MFTFIVRRVLFLPVVFLGVTLFIVLLMQLLSPAERASTFVRSEAQLRNIDAIIEQYGLNEPWYVAHLVYLFLGIADVRAGYLAADHLLRRV